MHIRTITSVLITMLFAALALGALAPAATHAAPESWDPKWHSVIVDNGNDDTGSHSSIAFNPVNYNPYVSYYRGSGRLNLAYYTTGSGLTCNEGWNCYNLDGDGTSQTGSENSMVFDANGTAWIGYNDPFYAETKLLSLDTNFNKSISVLRGDSGPGSVPSGADHMSFPSVGLLGGSPVVAVYDSFASIGGQWTIPRLVGLNYWHWDIEEYSQDTTVGYYPSRLERCVRAGCGRLSRQWQLHLSSVAHAELRDRQRHPAGLVPKCR